MYVELCACDCVCLCASALPHVYSGVCYASVQYMCTFRGPDGDKMYIQRSNPMRIQYMHKHSILLGHNGYTRDNI